MTDNIFLSNPIISIQTLLRTVLFYDEDEISTVIPDGIYGPETKRAVMDFQKKHGINSDGVVNYETWCSIINEYDKTAEIHYPPSGASIYPCAEFTISPYEENPHLIVIQAMMNNIAERYKNVPKNELNGIHDETSVNAVETLQGIFSIEKTGIINKRFWESLSKLYEVAVTLNFMLDN